MYPYVSPPTLHDLVGLITYVLGHPYLFISSTTVMTTGLVLGTAVLGAVRLGARQWGPAIDRAAGMLLHRLGPKLAVILAYFGIGSMILATEILFRFHQYIPAETEMQFRSGVGHLVVAALGIAVLWPSLRGHSAREWVVAHFWALVYWTIQVVVLTPPWFAFQGQGELVSQAARTALAIALGANLYAWRTVSASGTPQLRSAAELATDYGN